MPEKGQARGIASRFCVLVSSSDRGCDIFEIVFQNAETIWRDCDWPRYVGFTSQHADMYGFKAIAAKAPSDWRGEVGDYLDALPDHIDYVLRIDEDALFLSPVDGEKLNVIADLMVREDLSYVRLDPVSRNLPGRIIEYFRRKLDKRPLRRLSFSEPYYSSVGLVDLETQLSAIAVTPTRNDLGVRTHRYRTSPITRCGNRFLIKIRSS